MTYQQAKEWLWQQAHYFSTRKEAERDIECRKVIYAALEKQIPKKPYKDNENGVYEKEYCPACHRILFPNDHHCVCGQAIDWSDEQ